ncbi:MAG: hypothetical protein KDB27_36120 [Planctomycetales bacterium]|nr:hypothetical protein [Planctomycetales bacterium]
MSDRVVLEQPVWRSDSVVLLASEIFELWGTRRVNEQFESARTSADRARIAWLPVFEQLVIRRLPDPKDVVRHLETKGFDYSEWKRLWRIKLH